MGMEFNESVKSVIFNVARITCYYGVHESEVDMWIVTAECLGMIGGTSMSSVCGRNWSLRRMTEYQEAS